MKRFFLKTTVFQKRSSSKFYTSLCVAHYLLRFKQEGFARAGKKVLTVYLGISNKFEPGEKPPFLAFKINQNIKGTKFTFNEK